MASSSQSGPSNPESSGTTLISVLIPGDLLERLQRHADLAGEPITALGSRLLKEAMAALPLEEPDTGKRP